MGNPHGGGQRRVGLTELARQRLRDERASLHAQREQLRGDATEDNHAADSGDRAEAMRRADDVFRLEDRISEINRLLMTSPDSPAMAATGSTLADGSLITLQFPDGDEETFYASSILDAVPDDGDVEVLGLDSPLARALNGHAVGDTVRWDTPTGARQARVVKLRPPG